MFNQNQNQQPVNVPGGVANQSRQQADQRQQGNGFGKYTPSDTGMAGLLNANPADVGFDFDQASGSFQLINNKQTQQPANNQQTTSLPAQGSQVVNPQPNSTNGNDQYKDKFAAIDKQFNNITEALIRMASHMEGMGASTNGNQGQQQQQNQQQQSPTLDFQSDDFATNLISVINNAIDTKFKSFRDEFEPLKQTTGRMQDRIQGSDLALQYPEEFAKYMPVMQELKKSDPNKTWDKVFAEAKNLAPFLKTDSTIRTDNGNNQQAQGIQPQSDQNQIQNQQLQQRANQLQTESGSMPHGLVNQEPQINTIADAVNKSFRDLGIG